MSRLAHAACALLVVAAPVAPCAETAPGERAATNAAFGIYWPPADTVAPSNALGRPLLRGELAVRTTNLDASTCVAGISVSAVTSASRREPQARTRHDR